MTHARQTACLTTECASAMASRGSTWGEEEVKVLLEIWGDERVQSQFDGAKR